MTIDTNELRMLVQDFKLAGSPMFLQTTQMNELLDRLEAAEKATDEIESLQRYRTAFNEWIDKTEWMQKSLPAKYLGMHRADALKDLISELFDRLEATEKHAAELEERCAKWEAVFGHLGDTPDECGNAIIAARDELEERCAVLTDALRLAVRQNSRDMLMTAEELRSCEAALEETK